MIVNLDGLTSQQKQEREIILGKPYSFFEKISLGGIGSPRHVVIEASQPFSELLEVNVDINYANIELGRAGIQVGFRSRQHAYAWLIPYRKLSIFKNFGSFSVHADGLKMTLAPHLSDTVDTVFLRKLQTFKVNYFDDLPVRLQNQLFP